MLSDAHWRGKGKRQHYIPPELPLQSKPKKKTALCVEQRILAFTTVDYVNFFKNSITF